MTLRILLLVIITGICQGSAAWATSVAPPSLPALIGGSDGVVFGEVVAIEPERLELKISLYKRRSNGPVKFAVAKFKPTERLFGIPSDEYIRIAFVPDDQQPTDGLSLTTPILKVGEKRLLYLKRAADSDLLVANSHFSDGTHEGDQEAEAKLTRRICKLLEKPDDSLKSPTPEDRMLTAWALAARYRVPPSLTSENKLEEIPKAEAHAIVDGLLLLPDRNGKDLCDVASSLGNLTGKFDVPTSTVNGYNTAGVRQWLRDHRDDVQFVRYVGRAISNAAQKMP